MNFRTLLIAIGETKSGTFYEICDALGDDRPAKGDQRGWIDFFDGLRQAEFAGLIQTTAPHPGDRFEAAILTESGKEFLAKSEGQAVNFPAGSSAHVDADGNLKYGTVTA